MKASLTLNHQDRVALFYDEPFGVVPEWASLDVEKGEIYIGGHEIENKTVKLDKIDQRVYARIEKGTQILLILVRRDGAREPLETRLVPLMIVRQV